MAKIPKDFRNQGVEMGVAPFIVDLQCSFGFPSPQLWVLLVSRSWFPGMGRDTLVLLNRKPRLPPGDFVRQIRGLLCWLGRLVLMIEGKLVCYSTMEARTNTGHPGDSLGNLI